MTSPTAPLEARPARPLGRTAILTEVSDDVVEDFLQIYRDAFAPLEARSPARQSLTDEEFRHQMADPSVLKFVAFDRTDEIIGLALVASDLSTVPWISVPYYQERFPEHMAEGRLFYFGALLVRPDRQGGPWAKFLLDHLFAFFAEHRAIGAFDCCGFTVDVTGLPDLIERAGHRVARFELTQLDRQDYYAAIVEGPK
jgi:ribosomal protein S18 acetylase RimI-like enzyme